MYEALPEFPEGWGGVGKIPFRGEGMDIFWNNTLNELSLRSFLTASKPSRRSISVAKRKRRKRKKVSQNFYLCACASQDVVKRDSSGKKG